jgi:hypothetical protein
MREYLKTKKYFFNIRKNNVWRVIYIVQLRKV